MGKMYDAITPELQNWIEKQHMFFVATAPLSNSGHINCSPKGLDTFRVLDVSTVAYQDLTGSGIETIAHLKENGRIVVMFCAFEGPPKIVRLHGMGEVITASDEKYEQFVPLFPTRLGVRAYIKITVDRISDSCGYAVPVYDFKKNRDVLDKWTEAKGQDGLTEYRQLKNRKNIDGMSGLD